MKNQKLILSISLVVALFFSSQAKSYAHCEVPCGIYGDSIRIALIYEHIETVEKSMNQINELSKAENKNYNQIVRWVINKEEHANKIQEIVSQYFLHQRIKITDPSNIEAYAKYTNQLALLHHVSVFAMKSKQSTDLELISKLREAIHEFEHSYFHKHPHTH